MKEVISPAPTPVRKQVLISWDWGRRQKARTRNHRVQRRRGDFEILLYAFIQIQGGGCQPFLPPICKGLRHLRSPNEKIIVLPFLLSGYLSLCSLSVIIHLPTYLPTIIYQQNSDCQDIPQYAGFFPSMHITSPYFLEVRYAVRFALANGMWAQETLETFLGRRLTLTANAQLHMLSPLCHWDQDSSSYQPASQNKDKVVQDHPTSMLRAPAGWPTANV